MVAGQGLLRELVSLGFPEESTGEIQELLCVHNPGQVFVCVLKFAQLNFVK